MHQTIIGDFYRKINGKVVEEISGVRDISASKTNITGDTNVTGTIDATVDVKAGATDISLISHTHLLTTTSGAPDGEHTGNTNPPTP